MILFHGGADLAVSCGLVAPSHEILKSLVSFYGALDVPPVWETQARQASLCFACFKLLGHDALRECIKKQRERSGSNPWICAVESNSHRADLVPKCMAVAEDALAAF
eukprot:2809101-Amphidinium_carterae.1